MSIPGVTAERSLVPSSVEYHYGGHTTAEGVSPEFLDFIKEAFESVGDAFRKTAAAAADGIKKGFDSLNHAGQNAGRQFSCNNMTGNMFRCDGVRPLLGIAQMTQSCLNQAAELGPAGLAACGAIAGAFCPLLDEYCKSPQGKDRAAIINQACAGT